VPRVLVEAASILALVDINVGRSAGFKDDGNEEATPFSTLIEARAAANVLVASGCWKECIVFQQSRSAFGAVEYGPVRGALLLNNVNLVKVVLLGED
jgi:hypothetical protein